MSDLSKDELKTVFKEGMKEWLDEKFKDFGKFSFHALAVAAMGALVYFIFWVEMLKPGNK